MTLSGNISRKKAGTLQIIVALFFISSFLRIGTVATEAIANEADIGAELSNDAPIEGAREALDIDPLLAAFQAREARLAAREAQVADRIQALNIAEAEITEKIEALIAAEATLSATLALADTAAEADLTRLTTVYENMKPKDAAALFSEMSPGFASGFLGLMRPELAAGIMSELEPDIAYSISAILAGRNALVPTE